MELTAKLGRFVKLPGYDGPHCVHKKTLEDACKPCGRIGIQGGMQKPEATDVMTMEQALQLALRETEYWRGCAIGLLAGMFIAGATLFAVLYYLG
jgi:hypothetical protein